MSTKSQNDIIHAFQGIHQSQRDHANDSLNDYRPSFDGEPKLYFDCILKLKNIAMVTKCNLKELALENAQGAGIKCLKSLPADSSWKSVKAILKEQFSPVLTVPPENI